MAAQFKGMAPYIRYYNYLETFTGDLVIAVSFGEWWCFDHAFVLTQDT